MMGLFPTKEIVFKTQKLELFCREVHSDSLSVSYEHGISKLMDNYVHVILGPTKRNQGDVQCYIVCFSLFFPFFCICSFGNHTNMWMAV